MAVSQRYRSMAAESAQKARQSKSLRDISEFLRQQRSYTTLAEKEERLAGKPYCNNDDPLPIVPDAVTRSPAVDVRWGKIYINK